MRLAIQMGAPRGRARRGGDRLTLRPVRSSSPLRKKRGIWVFHGDRKISAADTDRALESVRQEHFNRFGETIAARVRQP
jgi:hypothetical protein